MIGESTRDSAQKGLIGPIGKPIPNVPMSDPEEVPMAKKKKAKKKAKK